MSELLKLENQLCHRFYTLSNAFTRAYRPLLKALDITYPQYVTLMALWEDDDITIAELLDRTAIDGGAMSLILKKLQDKGFLVVTKDKADKRVKRVQKKNAALASNRDANCAPLDKPVPLFRARPTLGHSPHLTRPPESQFEWQPPSGDWLPSFFECWHSRK